MSDNAHNSESELRPKPGEVTRRQFIAGAVATGALLSTGGVGLFSDRAEAETSNMLQPTVSNGIAWYNAKDWGVEGKGWPDTAAYYDRLPARAESLVTKEVWNLSRQSAGMCVQFETNSTVIHARWVLNNFRLAMPHMAATGVSGVDLYIEDKGEWHWVATGQPDVYPKLEKQLVNGLEYKLQRYRLYLPLYNGVTSVEIGVSPSATFKPIAPRAERPLLFYGSSIVQGACASRPGMCHPAILGRRLNLPHLNLGFSGSAKMEPDLARLFAELDPCVYVLDAVPNMVAAQVTERFEPFVRIIRQAHPDTPIVLVEDRAQTNTPYLPARIQFYADTRAAMQAAIRNLTASGIKNLHYVPREELFGTDGEGSVDGSHPTDLGFWRMAAVLEPVLRSVL